MEHWRTLFKPPRFLPLGTLKKPWDPEFGFFSQPQPNLDLPTRIEQWDAQVWAEMSPLDLLGEHQPRIFNVISTFCSTFGYWDVDQTPFLRDLIQAWWSSPIVTGCYLGWWHHSVKYLIRRHRRVAKVVMPPRGPHQIHQQLYLRGAGGAGSSLGEGLLAPAIPREEFSRHDLPYLVEQPPREGFCPSPNAGAAERARASGYLS